MNPPRRYTPNSWAIYLPQPDEREQGPLDEPASIDGLFSDNDRGDDDELATD